MFYLPSCRDASQEGRPAVEFFMGIRFRLVLLVLLLVAAIAVGVSWIGMRTMDAVQLESLIKRGEAIVQATTIPAGFSLLKNDQLAMDNLVAQIKKSHPELEYLAILDLDRNILAHNLIGKVGSKFSFMSGEPLDVPDDLTVVKGFFEDQEIFEFRRSILFAGQHIGSVVAGVSTRELVASRASVKHQSLIVAGGAVALALLGAILLSSIFTRPLERLADGVSRLSKEAFSEAIPVSSRNELGVLTRNFNKMARTIQQQKQSLQEYADNLESSYNDIVRVLAAALDARDNYTYGHSARVAGFALGVAEKLNFDEDELKSLELACLLHDIGKIHVPDAVLNKQDKLDRDEYRNISEHPVLGSQILEIAPSLHKYIPAVKHHHERFDGTGYPDQLSRDAIPVHAQILALADTYDAMTSSRPYRKGLGKEEAIAEIRRCSGSQFNPQLVELFIEGVTAMADSEEDMLPLPEMSCAS